MKHTKNKQSNTPVDINSLSLYELCRWAALKDAIDITAEKCEEKSIDFSTFDLPPLALLKYVDTATDSLYNKVITEYEKI
jgi:hypothetical protein